MLTTKKIIAEFEESSNDIKFLEFNKKLTDSIERPQELKFILEHFSYITVNGYLKILGNDSENGFSYCNKLFSKCYNSNRYLIAYDILGGLFAINIEKLNAIEYFAPDTLEYTPSDAVRKIIPFKELLEMNADFYRQLRM